jgi:hypothetical protein
MRPFGKRDAITLYSAFKKNIRTHLLGRKAFLEEKPQGFGYSRLQFAPGIKGVKARPKPDQTHRISAIGLGLMWV